jgi:hypothetical protein
MLFDLVSRVSPKRDERGDSRHQNEDIKSRESRGQGRDAMNILLSITFGVPELGPKRTSQIVGVEHDRSFLWTEDIAQPIGQRRLS